MEKTQCLRQCYPISVLTSQFKSINMWTNLVSRITSKEVINHWLATKWWALNMVSPWWLVGCVNCDCRVKLFTYYLKPKLLFNACDFNIENHYWLFYCAIFIINVLVLYFNNYSVARFLRRHKSLSYLPSEGMGFT